MHIGHFAACQQGWTRIEQNTNEPIFPVQFHPCGKNLNAGCVRDRVFESGLGWGGAERRPQSQKTESVMAGSVNKVILIGNLGADPEGPPDQFREAGGQSPRRDFRKLARQGQRRAQGKDRVAPRRDLQRGPCQDRRAISEEGRQGLHRGPAADAQMAGPERSGPLSTEVVLQGFNSALTMLDGRGGGGGADSASTAATSAAPARCKAARAGRRSPPPAAPRRHGRRDSVLVLFAQFDCCSPLPCAPLLEQRREVER